MKFSDIYKNVNKTAAAMLTPQAQQAAMQPDPAAAQGMPPMSGAPMPPADAAPMDPAMAGAAPVPAGAPMPPAPMGGAPMPAGGAWMQDQMFMDFLMQSGFQFDQMGNVIDPNGQPMPPELMEQLYAEFQNQMAQAPRGAPAEGALAQGAPMQQPPLEMPQEVLNQIAGIVQDVIDSSLQEKLATLDKKITAFADKLDTMKSILDDMISGVDKQTADKAEQASVDAELEKELKSAAGTDQVNEPAATQQTLEQPAPRSTNFLDMMRGA